jgi:hypothetical protein
MNKKIILIMSFLMVLIQTSGISKTQNNEASNNTESQNNTASIAAKKAPTQAEQSKLNASLLLAVGSTNMSDAKKLLDQGANPEGKTTTDTPLNYAKTIANQKMIDLLQSYIDKNKSTDKPN